MVRPHVAVKFHPGRLPGPLVALQPESHGRETRPIRFQHGVHVIRDVPFVPVVVRGHTSRRQLVFLRRSVVPRHILLRPASRPSGAPCGKVGGTLPRIGHVQPQRRLTDLSLGDEARRVKLENAHDALVAVGRIRLPGPELDAAVVVVLIPVARPALERRVVRGFERFDARHGAWDDADVRRTRRPSRGVRGNGVDHVPSLRRRRP